MMNIRSALGFVAVCALLAAGCSFTPDYTGSKLDCTDKPCPKGWYCPESGEKVCVQGEAPGGDAGGGADGGTGGGKDGGHRDTGGACTDTCLSEKQMACVTQNSYHLCAYGESGCLEWGPERYCTGSCENDKCSGCTVDCTGKDCGDDGCSGSCGSCTRPPPDACKDSRTLTTYDSDGTCTDHTCDYAPHDTDCTYGCGNGRCADCTPSCAGKECGDDGCGTDCAACDKPPAGSCLNAATLRHYDPAGACQSNKCSYTYTDINCPNGCDAATLTCKGCQKDCSGKQCGSDGCGGDCGGCGAYAICNAQSQCECPDGTHINCDGSWSDGCETNRLTDPFNCGNCNSRCTPAHTAVPGCAGGQCTVVTCETNWGDCNTRDADGCETDLTSDNANCLVCGKGCPPHAHCTAGGCQCDATATACGASCCAAGEQCCNNACVQPQWTYREAGALAYGGTYAPSGSVYVAGTKNNDAYVLKIDGCGQKAAEVLVDNGGYADTATAIVLRTQIFIGSWFFVGGTTGSAVNGQEGFGTKLTEAGQTFTDLWKVPYYGSVNQEEVWGLDVDPSMRVWLYGTSNVTADGSTQTADWLVVADGYTGGAAGYSPVSQKLGIGAVGRRIQISGDKAYTCGALYDTKAYVGVIPLANCDSTTVTTCVAESVLEVADSQWQTEFRDLRVAGGAIYAAGFRVTSSDRAKSEAAVWKLDTAGNVLKTFVHPASGGADAFDALNTDSLGNVYACGHANYSVPGTGDGICYKLTGDLVEQWHMNHATAGTDYFSAVVSGSDSSVYAIGGENNSTLVVVKCDPNGTCGN